MRHKVDKMSKQGCAYGLNTDLFDNNAQHLYILHFKPRHTFALINTSNIPATYVSLIHDLQNKKFIHGGLWIKILNADLGIWSSLDLGHSYL